MSLIVEIRAAKGLVLATDSFMQRDDAVFLTARKLFTFPSQPHLAVAICGTLSLGRGNLRPVSVLMDALTSDPATHVSFSGFDRVPTAIFAAYWGHTAGVLGIVAPYTSPFDFMPLTGCADLAQHLIISTAQLAAWSTMPQRIGGLVQLVTITQADGARTVPHAR